MNAYEMAHVSQKFVQYLQGALAEHGINLNITNQRGMIIASSCEDSIKKFCEPAFRAIDKNQTVLVSCNDSPEFSNAREGIYIPLHHGQNFLGALGLEGNLQQAFSLKSMCLLTAKSFFEMEFYKESYWGKLDQRNIFTKILLYCEEDPFPSEVHHITEKFNIDTTLVRIPILFILRYNELSEDKLITEFKKNPSHTSQDIICITRGQNAVVFRALSQDPSLAVSQYRESVDTYIKNAQQLSINNGQPFICTIGSLQNKLLNYHRAFRHTLWVCNNCADVTYEHETMTYYFYDYVFEYIQSQINMEETSMIFNVFSEVLLNREWDSFSRNMGSLLHNNMNISQSAKDLYLHRNTLINWINRYKQLFGVDPVNDNVGREFTQQLYHFYTHSLTQ
ncbi:sugar diacid recognition domain-containing protein [Enterocloster citroniae]|uniref:sugar diacid recognition domain-containing protein n=1 Tax=Enterocloster citroniae TaxID=358743 RepID=UPI00349EEDDA